MINILTNVKVASYIGCFYLDLCSVSVVHFDYTHACMAFCVAIFQNSVCNICVFSTCAHGIRLNCG